MAENLLVAKLPIGIEGFNGSNNLSQMNIGELSDATNISYDQSLIQKEMGAVKWNSTTLESGADIIAGHYWQPTDSAEYDVVYVNGKLLRDTVGDGTFSTTLKSGLSVAPVVGQFIDAGKESGTDNRKLFFVNGADAVEYVDGTGVTTTAATSPAADWTGTNQPITGDVHEDRVWMAGNLNDPHRVYYSTVADHSDFTTVAATGAGTVSVYPGESGNITRVVSFKGFLLVFKQYGLYYIDTRDPLVINWKTGRVSRNIGTMNPMAVDIVDDDVVFIDQVGMIRAVSTLSEFGSIGTQNLSDMHEINRWLQSNITYAQIHHARTFYFPRKREVHFSLPIQSSTSNNVRLIMDLSEGRSRWRIVDRDDAYSMWVRRESLNDTMAFGDGSGFVYIAYDTGYSKDGAYSSRFETAPTDFSDQDPQLGARNKAGHYLELVLEPASAGTLNIDIIWDNISYQTVAFNLEPPGAALGVFEFGLDVLSGSSTLKNLRKRITGQGRRFAIAGRHTGNAENFKIAEAFVGFKLADHRLTHGET